MLMLYFDVAIKSKIRAYCLRLALFRTYTNTCTAMYHLENYCVRSAVYKIHAKHTLKRSHSHMWAVAQSWLVMDGQSH